MIRERPAFKSLNSADVMERVNTHKEQEEEKRDLYGSTQRKNHALKAVADASSDGNAEEDSDDLERLSKDLALITKRSQRFHKKRQFKKRSSSNSGGSKSALKLAGEYTRVKCKKPRHFIFDCPLLEAKIRASGRYDSVNHRGKNKRKKYDSEDEKETKKFFKKKDNSTSKSLSRSSSRNPSKSSSNRKNTSRKAKAYIGKAIDSDEEESSGSEEEEESDEDSDSGMDGIACASSPTTNFFGDHSSNDESPA
nr:nucleolar transcription factor 1-like [Aegilops tauschii subsp. strangulata]